jgi:hypothetical protein
MKRLLALAIPAFALASEARPRTWSATATLSFVDTSGNASGQTFSFSNEYSKKWDHMALVLNGKTIRSAAVVERVVAIGPSMDELEVMENSSTSVTAEKYYLKARFDYRLKDRDMWYWYGGTSWEQNPPAGLYSRTDVTVGVGRILADSAAQKWRVDAGIGAKREVPSYLRQGFQKENGTFNLTSSFRHTISENLNYSADLSDIVNLKKFADMVVALKQSLSVSMTKGTAIKIGFDVSHRNLPPMISVRAFAPSDPPAQIGSMAVSAKKLDTEATASLVVTF